MGITKYNVLIKDSVDSDIYGGTFGSSLVAYVMLGWKLYQLRKSNVGSCSIITVRLG